jgi:predicted lipoprotein with Yx(FWY)xxD motif
MIKGAVVVAVAIALAVILAGCGGGASSSSATASSKAASSSSAKSSSPASSGSASSSSASTGAGSATVVAAKRTGLGMILVDSKGRTLYLFTPDKHGKSACYGACAKAWPPFTGKPRAGKGVSTAKLGTITRKDGSTQVTYDGHPLYYFASDSKPGDTKGEGLKGFGGEWYVVSPSGHEVEKESGGGGSGGGGY